MLTVNISQAKSRLAELVDQAAAGNEIVIVRKGRPVARLTAVPKTQKRMICLGALEGQGWIADDFDDPLPDDLVALFEGRNDQDDV